MDKYGNACWSDTPSTASYKTSIREDSLIEMMEYIIDNMVVRRYIDFLILLIPTPIIYIYIYNIIKVGNKVFRQQMGIPMGTDSAPLLANLFLFYYEYE